MTRPATIAPTPAHRVSFAVEYRARRMPLGAGYVVSGSFVSRSAIDLLAARAGYPPLMVQCRIGPYLIPSERAVLLEAAERAGGAALVVGLDAGRVAWW